MNRVASDSRPRLKPGCRLSDSSGQEAMLLIPEGALRLSGAGPKILELCDGRRTFADIVRELQAVYPSAEPGQIEAEATSFVERLQQKRVMDF